ncbi:MAG: hypothetical protein IKZ82_07445 [Clostridia bacterium]|nr:hypothetical protein [Clostridia bacterium]
MEIIRFALGIRFAPSEGDEAEVISRLLSEVAKKRFRGMKLYAGHCTLDEEDDPRILTVVTMGQGIRKTKALYASIAQSPVLAGMLAAHRPIILTNVIARIEALDFLGEFNKKGELLKKEPQEKSAETVLAEQ